MITPSTPDKVFLASDSEIVKVSGLLGLSPPVEDLGATTAVDKFGFNSKVSIAWTTTGSLLTAIGRDIGTEESFSKFDICLTSSSKVEIVSIRRFRHLAAACLFLSRLIRSRSTSSGLKSESSCTALTPGRDLGGVLLTVACFLAATTIC